MPFPPGPCISWLSPGPPRPRGPKRALKGERLELPGRELLDENSFTVRERKLVHIPCTDFCAGGVPRLQTLYGGDHERKSVHEL